MHWGINSPPKIPPPPSFLPSPPLNLQTVPAPQPPFMLVFRELIPPLKVGFFSERLQYQSFSSLTPSYLVKVTKFFVNIHQFEFLVMTEENVFVYKLFVIKYFRF